jgi:hypothetical protein
MCQKILIFFYSLFILICTIEQAWTKENVLVLASNEPIPTHNSYYCAVLQVFNNMGYSINIVHAPLIRGELEAQKGNYSLVDIYKLSFSTQSSYTGDTVGIEVTKTPYLTEAVNVYSHQGSEIVISDNSPISSYKIGVIRNQYSYYKAESSKNNYTYYGTALAAFKGLNLRRVDLVISPPKAYQLIKSQLKNSKEISVLFSYGVIYRHIGLSHRYFGINKAKKLAQQYNKEMTQFFQDPSLNCANISPP